MVHVLDLKVGQKGPQEHKLKLYVASQLLQKTKINEINAGSTSPPFQLIPLSPI